FHNCSRRYTSQAKIDQSSGRRKGSGSSKREGAVGAVPQTRNTPRFQRQCWRASMGDVEAVFAGVCAITVSQHVTAPRTGCSMFYACESPGRRSDLTNSQFSILNSHPIGWELRIEN